MKGSPGRRRGGGRSAGEEHRLGKEQVEEGREQIYASFTGCPLAMLGHAEEPGTVRVRHMQ